MDTVSIVPDYVEPDDVVGPDPGDIILLSQSTNALNQASEQLSNIYQTIGDEQDYLENLSQIISLQETIHTHATILQDISTKQREIRASLLPQVLTQVQSLPETMHFHDELKSIWAKSLLIKIHGVSYLTDNDWDEIRTIAKLCPLDYGHPVYEARSLLSYKGEYDFDDVEITCQSSKTRSISKEDESKITCFPNPSSGAWTIALDEVSDEDYNVSVINNNRYRSL